jgi:hypothetical protein
MTTARTQEVDAAAALVRQAIDKVQHLHGSPREAVTTNGIVTVLTDAVRRIEALDGDEGA